MDGPPRPPLPWHILLLGPAALLGGAAAQRAGTLKAEAHPPLPVERCTAWEGCTIEEGTAVVMDMNWRWLHAVGGFNNCFDEDKWNRTVCPDPKSCSRNCALEGVDLEGYTQTYGVTPLEKGISLRFPHAPRLYVTSSEDSYKLFKLKNREFAVDIDVSKLPCGMNAALYFTEMPANGGATGGDEAGARLGAGYCDARCPHTRFIQGEANLEEWKPPQTENPEGQVLRPPAEGRYGICCTELDVFEGNSRASRFAAHPCKTAGPRRCSGVDECGTEDRDGPPGICAKNGCSFNSYRLGNRDFFGAGPGFTIDTTKPMTVVTQFFTEDNTDEGDLVEIRRFYIQDGKQIQEPKAHADMGAAQGTRGLNEDFCSPEHRQLNDAGVEFKELGGLKAMGEAFDRGMVLSMSIWDEDTNRMLWLDGNRASWDEDTSTPGVSRGPCNFEYGNEKDLKAYAKKHGDIEVTFTNIRYGELGSTYKRSAFALNSDDGPAAHAAVREVSRSGFRAQFWATSAALSAIVVGGAILLLRARAGRDSSNGLHLYSAYPQLSEAANADAPSDE